MSPSRPLPDPLQFPVLMLLLLLLPLLTLIHPAHGIRCVQCKATGHEEDCNVNPPPPIECGTNMKVCLKIHTYTPVRDDSREMLSLVRTCAPVDMGWDCKRGSTEADQAIDVCHDTCNWDGCNPAPSTVPVLPVVAALLCTALFL